ncbi:unnamed protein product [Spodoptera littoralis]|uniref:PH domain-containing protein n=1 Tax=Spodoptera littoralis TaxID=7109 RepID=A0A9P0N529_SPOLI|nr:unnamed protein product [Spodoptera littoralis]CAH1642723.1 unnamed protein product [Spodoptera littoralis]
MSSSPAVEPSSPSTTPSSPALRADCAQFHSSTPYFTGRKAPQPPLNVVLPVTAPATPPTYKTAVGGVTRPASTALSRKESYKAQRQHYRREKKRAASALLHSIEDPSVVVLADWLKVRGSLKSWTKLWCVLKPGLLLLYKSPKAKSSHWVGTVLLTSCQVIERPSKKDGFCFKLYHPLEQSIWAPRGPHNETIDVPAPVPSRRLQRIPQLLRQTSRMKILRSILMNTAGELVEEVAEENKSLLWFLLKQVRPGMDLSKVVLPTFILEPRSFLDKLSDNYYHADILAEAQQVEDPYQRFVAVLRWYLSGLYRKPKGLKKPYNPEESNLFDVSLLKEQRLPRFLMNLDKQQEFESAKLWLKVSEAIMNEDQILEYEEDFVIKTLRDGAPVKPSAEIRRDLARRVSDSDSHDELTRPKTSARTLKQSLYAIDTALREQTLAIERLSKSVETISEGQRQAAAFRPQNVGRVPTSSHSWDLFGGFVLAMVLQALLNWVFYQKD